MLRTTVATVALALALAACGGAEPEPAADPTPTATPTQPPTSDAPLPCVPGTEPFTGEAADEFGAERVMAAYCLLADLASEQTSTTLALPIPEQRPQDLRSVRSLLTDRAKVEHEDLTGLTLHDVRRVPQGYQRADDGPYVYGTTVGPATAEVEGDALALTFTLDTGLVLEERGDDTGRHLLLPVTRNGTYVLVPDGDRWLVDDWDVSFERGPVRLVTG